MSGGAGVPGTFAGHPYRGRVPKEGMGRSADSGRGGCRAFLFALVGRGGIEPPNLPVFSRTLYQLSYLPMASVMLHGSSTSCGPDGI